MRTKSKKSNWMVSMGFATGVSGKNASWFHVNMSFENCTAGEAIHETRLAGYRLSNNICADWVFGCQSPSLGMLDQDALFEAEKEASDILISTL